MTTPRLGLQTVPSNILQPSVPVNDTLQVLDVLVQGSAKQALGNTPPATVDADAGEAYIVGSTPTGAWAGHGFEVAICTAANTWRFVPPKPGMTFYVEDQGTHFVNHGTGWAPLIRVATKTASADLALSDRDVILMNVASANTLTIISEFTVPIPIGRTYRVVQLGAGATSIVAGSGVTIRTAGSLTLGTQYASGVLVKIASDEWLWTVNGSSALAPGSVTAADLAAGVRKQVIAIACSDESTALTSGSAKVTFRMPYAFTLSAVRASLTTAQTSGSIFTVDINEGGTSILSTKLTLDNTEKTSTTAATAPVISDTALADDAEITVDIDQIGDGTAKGLKVYLIGEPA